MKRNSRIAGEMGINAAVFVALNAEPAESNDRSRDVDVRQSAPDLLNFASNLNRQWEFEQDALNRLRENGDSAWAQWWVAFCRTDDLVAEIVDEFREYPGWDAHRLHAPDVVIEKMGRFVTWYNCKGYWYGWNIGERLEERYRELKFAIDERDAALESAEQADERLAEYRNRLTLTELSYELRQSEFNRTENWVDIPRVPRRASIKQLAC